MNTEIYNTLFELPPVAAGKVKQPEFRFPSGTALLSIIMGREKELLWSREQDRMVFDAFDRVPPIDPAELARDGEEWRTNADFGDTEAAITGKVETVNNLLTQPCPHISFTYKKETPPDIMDRLGLFAFILYKWMRLHPVFIEEIQQLAFHMVSTGVGMLNFGTPGSWYFNIIPRTNIIYPKNSKKNLTKLPWMSFRIEQGIIDLIAKLDDPEASTAMGWDVKVIREVIKNLLSAQTNTNMPTLDSEPDKWAEGLMANAYSISAQLGETVQAYRHYTMEFDGLLSEQIVIRMAITTSTDNQGMVVYKKKTEYKDFTKFLVPFYLSIGSTYIEKIRGFGHRILPQAAVMNDLDCRSIDVTILSGSLMLKAKNQDNVEQAQRELRLGSVVTIVSEDLEIDQKAFSNPAQGLIQLGQNIRNRRAVNDQVFGGPDGSSQAPATSATGAKLMYSNAAKGAGFEADRLNLANNLFHKTLWERLVAIWTDTSIPPVEGKEDALEFWKQAEEECGISKEDLDWVLSVSANSLLGDGDPGQVFMALHDLSPYLVSAPLTAQKEAVRMAVAARTRKPELAYRWFPVGSMEADREMSEQSWRVTVEDGQFEISDLPVPVRDDDNHLVHAEGHTKYALGVLDSWNQKQLQPDEAFKRLFRCKMHTGVHLQRLSMNKAAESSLREMNKQWQGIENMMRRMQQMVQEAQQAEQQRQLEELKNPSISVKDREHMMTGQLQRQQMQEEHATKLGMMQQDADAKVQLLQKQALTSELQQSIRDSTTIRADASTLPIPPAQ